MSFFFNGSDLMLSGFNAYNIKNVLVPGGNIPKVMVPYHDGEFAFERFHQSRNISLDFVIQDQRTGAGKPDPRGLYDKVAKIVGYPRTPCELKLETEPDRFYRAVLGSPVAGFQWKGPFACQGSMEFFCADPFGYSITPQVYGPTANNATAVLNEHIVFDTGDVSAVGGTVDNEPIIEFDALVPGTFNINIVNNSNGEEGGYTGFEAAAGNDHRIRLVGSTWRWQVFNTGTGLWVDSMAGATGGFPRLVPGEPNTLVVSGTFAGGARTVRVDYTPRFL